MLGVVCVGAAAAFELELILVIELDTLIVADALGADWLWLAGAEVEGAEELPGRVIVTPALAQYDCANCSVFWMSDGLQAVWMHVFVLARKDEDVQTHFASVTWQPVAVMPLRAQLVAQDGSWLRS